MTKPSDAQNYTQLYINMCTCMYICICCMYIYMCVVTQKICVQKNCMANPPVDKNKNETQQTEKQQHKIEMQIKEIRKAKNANIL